MQYVQTRDGYRIAFAACGAGPSLVLMPQPLSHVNLMWRAKSHAPFFEQLAQRFQLIQYDGRGLGLSDRGLPDDFSVADGEPDLEAVVDAAGLERLLIFAPQPGHVAIRYAVAHADRVQALILDLATRKCFRTHKEF